MSIGKTKKYAATDIDCGIFDYFGLGL